MSIISNYLLEMGTHVVASKSDTCDKCISVCFQGQTIKMEYYNNIMEWSFEPHGVCYVSNSKPLKHVALRAILQLPK